MASYSNVPPLDGDPSETQEWREALSDVVRVDGVERAAQLLRATLAHSEALAVPVDALRTTPYVNTLPSSSAAYPGDLALEQQLENAIRWNAAMMVVRANQRHAGIGGHLSTYASAATLYEVGFNHIFKGPGAASCGDQIFYQGHATPGLYARAFLEGRLSAAHLDAFRTEVGGKGLSSYPHPWLMPDFWQFPTVSMGLGPISAIYQARYNKYLLQRGLHDTSQSRVFAFLGDGECDEPESLGALGMANREGLDNLIFVINCNLQRLDGPVRGNGKIVDELEGIFRGAGWRVLKVLWSQEWRGLLDGAGGVALEAFLSKLKDGASQTLHAQGLAGLRAALFGEGGPLAGLGDAFSDAQLLSLKRGGHCHESVYAAYRAAEQSTGPVCILAHTVKGWQLGAGFESSNATHQLKKLDMAQVKALRDRLDLPLTDAALSDLPYYHPGENSPLVQYLQQRRAALGGPLPQRQPKPSGDVTPDYNRACGEFASGSSGQAEVSTTMAFVRLLRNLLRDKTFGKWVVPIVPDEARTFGMDAFFKEFGIYAPFGQQYEPVDKHLFLNYREAHDGQLLEEGITEAGAMASFTAAGSAHSTFGAMTVPFYIFYSMFGLQRVGDQIWAAGDARCRGFLLGATAGRTTLHGEGLQHDDGHSHLFALAYPRLVAYDPAFAYETAAIVKAGLQRMLAGNEDVIYYITLYNENYLMPPMPPDAEAGILKGAYLFRKGSAGKHSVKLLGSGPIIHAALEAQQILADKYDVAADVYSVTSYQQLYREARAVERQNRLNPSKKPKVPYITQLLGDNAPVIAVSDHVAELPSLLARFMPGALLPLGTSGYSRSDTREQLRAHFEISAAHVVTSALYALSQSAALPAKKAAEAMAHFKLKADKPDPFDA